MTKQSSTPNGSNARKGKSPKTLIVKLNLSPNALRPFAPKGSPKPAAIKDEASSTSNTITAPTSTSSPGENVSESASNTPVPNAAGGPTAMLPPTEVVKKKGGKRSSAAAGLGADLTPKVRGKPGPKKRPRLEDGSIDPNATSKNGTTATASGAHKLGPKANQGAINAGLRALDRSGKPCRKWQKGGFTLKSFTGVVWEIPRWRAPPKLTLGGDSEGSTSTGADSSKENKDSTGRESEKSNSAADVEMGSAQASINASSPAPIATAAA